MNFPTPIAPMPPTSTLRRLGAAVLALAVVAPLGCGAIDDASPTTARAARGGEDYAWGSVELINYDHVGGIVPCVHVGPEIFDDNDVDDLTMHTQVSYVDPESGAMVLETFEVPLADAEITELEGEVSVELPLIELGAAPDEETLAVTAEVTTDIESLPDFWSASVIDADLDQESGINPCFLVAHAAHAMSQVNEVSMTVLASYADARGGEHTDEFSVELSTTEIVDLVGPDATVEPPTALQLSAAPVEETLVVQATLSW